MLLGSRCLPRTVLVSSLLLWGPASLAQVNPAWIEPRDGQPQSSAALPDIGAPSGPEPGTVPPTALQPATTQTRQDDQSSTATMRSVKSGAYAVAEPAAPPRSAQAAQRTASVTYRLTRREQAARDLAFAYLDHWSAPNRVTLASASSFYAPSVTFHGQTRSLASVIAEKRRVAERWPDRNYRYRPGTTQVACEAHRENCTVWSIFDFSARDPHHGRRSLGIGDHELVVSFSGSKPVIVSETSRVLRRGAVPGLVLAKVAASADQVEAMEGGIEGPGPDDGKLTTSPYSGEGALSACRDAIATASRPYGGTHVTLTHPKAAATGSSLSFDAQVEYRSGSRHEVRQSRVTCRLGDDGRVVKLQ